MKKKKFTIIADTAKLHGVRKAVTGFIGSSVERSETAKIVLAVDEAVANIIIHGYRRDSKGEICIEMESDSSGLRFIITDMAPHFNPLELEPQDIDGYLDSGKAGGLGVDITRRMMDVQYEKIETGGNRLILSHTFKKEDI